MALPPKIVDLGKRIAEFIPAERELNQGINDAIANHTLWPDNWMTITFKRKKLEKELNGLELEWQNVPVGSVSELNLRDEVLAEVDRLCGLMNGNLDEVAASQAAPMARVEAEDTPGAKPVIWVPATLFDGKTPMNAREALRKEGIAEHTIAYVLSEFMGINTTEVGRLLKRKTKDGLAPADSTVLRYAKKLLTTAATFTIIRE